MAGGQQIDSATGTIGDARTVPLRSRKTGTGAATFQLTGIASAVGQGMLRQATALLGHALTPAQGAVTAVVPVSWLAPIAPSFQAGSTTPYSLAALVSNYNAGTDTFAWETGYTPPSWLSIDFANLQPSGAQVDADDIASSPGLRIRVSRSTGGSALSAPFGVTVYIAGSGVATWVEWGQFSYAYGSDSAGVGNPYTTAAFGNWPTVTIPANYAAWQAAVARVSTVEQPADVARIIRPIYGGYYEPVWEEETGKYIIVVPG